MENELIELRVVILYFEIHGIVYRLMDGFQDIILFFMHPNMSILTKSNQIFC